MSSLATGIHNFSNSLNDATSYRPYLRFLWGMFHQKLFTPALRLRLLLILGLRKNIIRRTSEDVLMRRRYMIVQRICGCLRTRFFIRKQGRHRFKYRNILRITEAGIYELRRVRDLPFSFRVTLLLLGVEQRSILRPIKASLDIILTLSRTSDNKSHKITFRTIVSFPKFDKQDQPPHCSHTTESCRSRKKVLSFARS